MTAVSISPGFARECGAQHLAVGIPRNFGNEAEVFRHLVRREALPAEGPQLRLVHVHPVGRHHRGDHGLLPIGILPGVDGGVRNARMREEELAPSST